MLLHSPEMHIQLMQMLQKHSQRRALSHLCEGIHIFWEALSAIAEFAIRTRHVSVGIVDVA